MASKLKDLRRLIRAPDPRRVASRVHRRTTATCVEEKGGEWVFVREIELDLPDACTRKAVWREGAPAHAWARIELKWSPPKPVKGEERLACAAGIPTRRLRPRTSVPVRDCTLVVTLYPWSQHWRTRVRWKPGCGEQRRLTGRGFQSPVDVMKFLEDRDPSHSYGRPLRSDHWEFDRATWTAGLPDVIWPYELGPEWSRHARPPKTPRKDSWYLYGICRDPDAAAAAIRSHPAMQSAKAKLMEADYTAPFQRARQREGGKVRERGLAAETLAHLNTMVRVAAERALAGPLEFRGRGPGPKHTWEGARAVDLAIKILTSFASNHTRTVGRHQEKGSPRSGDAAPRKRPTLPTPGPSDAMAMLTKLIETAMNAAGADRMILIEEAAKVLRPAEAADARAVESLLTATAEEDPDLVAALRAGRSAT